MLGSVVFTKVVVSRKAENGFRRRALKALPNEFIEMLYGYVKNRTLYICAFVDLEHTAKPEWVEYEEDDLEACDHAKGQGLHYVGTIHTHPDRDTVAFSEADMAGLEDSDDLVMGICAVEYPTEENGLKRRKVRIAYWPNMMPLKLDYKV